MAPGRIAREDYEYVRHGTANVYCIVEPKAGRHLTHATRDRKAPRFVRRPAADRPSVSHGEDDSSHHGQLESARRERADPRPRRQAGVGLWARFTPHYTPKHGSWLNPAEIEASLWSRECHGRDRVDTFEALRDRTRAWTARADRRRRTIIWRFTTAKARRVFRYKRRSTMSRSRH